MNAIHNATMPPCTHTAPVAETVKPVATVSHAARHIGHFGNNTSKAAGRTDGVNVEAFRASPREFR